MRPEGHTLQPAGYLFLMSGLPAFRSQEDSRQRRAHASPLREQPREALSGVFRLSDSVSGVRRKLEGI